MDGRRPALCAMDCKRNIVPITLHLSYLLTLSTTLSGCLLEERDPISADSSLSADPDGTTGPASTDGGAINISGSLVILYVDEFEKRRSERQFFLEDKQSNQRWRLRFQGTPPGYLRSGMNVQVRGKAKGQEIVVAANGASGSPNTLSIDATVVSGDQKTIVMIGNFSDASVSCTPDSIRDMVFTDPADQSVDDLYKETSHGALSLSGEVRGPYTVDQTRDACDFNVWADALDMAASNEGVNLSGYSRRVYVMPRNGCSASGIGTVGGNPSRAWVFRCDISDVYAHELGHNFGMHHAATPSSEYGDYTDVMGLARNHLRQVNAPHKEQMGWVTSSQVMTISKSGVYDIAPLEFDATVAIAPQALKIFTPDTGEYYYLSYRRPIGFDANMNSLYVDRVSLHRYSGDGTATKTRLLALLADGESFVDSSNGFSFTTIGHNDDYATVSISFEGSTPPPSCTPASPLVTLSPADQSSVAGAPVDYVINVANQDGSACDVSNFVLSYELPAGWTGSLTTGALALGPGDTDSAMLTVYSPTDSPNGDYAIAVTAIDDTVTEHVATGNAIYTVANNCVPAAPALTVSPGSQDGNPGATLDYTLTLVSNDSVACNQSTYQLTVGALPSGWNSNLSATSLTLAPGDSLSAIMRVTSTVTTASGNYSVPLAASSDGQSAHNTSAVAIYAVTDTEPALDTEPPSKPTGLSATPTGKRIDLAWIASADNSGVDGYFVYRNGMQIASIAETAYSDRTVEKGVTYIYTVAAFDAFDNVSAASSPVSATIEAKGGGSGKQPK